MSNGPNSGNPGARRMLKVVGSAARRFRDRAVSWGKAPTSSGGIKAASAVAAVAFYLVSGTLALDDHCSESEHSIAVVESVCHRITK